MINVPRRRADEHESWPRPFMVYGKSLKLNPSSCLECIIARPFYLHLAYSLLLGFT